MTSTTDGVADSLRQFNRQRVVTALRDLEAASRADLSRLTRREVVGAALGLPAPVDNHGRTPTKRFAGLDLAERSGLAALTGRISIRNDADLGALGEALFGAGRGTDHFIYVKVSRGIGA